MKPGKYNCKVIAPTNGWFGEAGESATPFIRIPLEVTDEGPCLGEELEFAAWISDKSMERSIKNLKEVFGFNGDLLALSRCLTTGPFVGKTCSVTCEEEEWKGKMTVKVKWLNRAGGGGMEPDKATALAARLNDAAKGFAADFGLPF